MDRGGAILCTVFGSTNCNFPSFGKQNISNSLVGCRVLQSLRPEVGLMSPFLYFPLPFLMLSWSSCVLPAILHDHSLDATSLPIFHRKGYHTLSSIRDLLQLHRVTSRHFNSCAHVASSLPMDFVNQNGLFCSTEAHGLLHAVCLIPCPVPLFAFSP